MAKQKQVIDDSIKPDTNHDGEESEKAQLVKLLSNPDFTALLSLTNIPLAQINALAWTLAFADYVKYCQEKHDNVFLPIEQRKVIKPVLLEKLYVEYYCRLRESLEGENKNHLVTLARDQIQSLNESESPMIDLHKMPRQ